MKSLIEFIDSCHSPYHVIANIESILEKGGYSSIDESAEWSLKPGGKYYTTRNLSSLIAFKIPETVEPIGFMLSATHSDSPCYKIKLDGEAASPSGDMQIGVEPYGGMIAESWIDRPLSAAGKVIIKTADGIEARLIDIDRDMFIIPGVAIHMRRGTQESKMNPAVDLQPLFGGEFEKGQLKKTMADALKIDSNDILSADIFLYNRMKGTKWGPEDEFISAPRLDDLQCVYGCARGFTEAEKSPAIPVLCVFDNEEVGSETRQGAASDFLQNTLVRISAALGKSGEGHIRMLSNSLMVSADNAHAIHPNHPEYADKCHAPRINAGIVIKYNANRRYTTDAVSDALFRAICDKCGVSVQSYSNRPDIPGGSTLGSIASARVSVPTIDIGLPQLAMHSSYETAGAADTEALIRAMTCFYSCAIENKGEKEYKIK